MTYNLLIHLTNTYFVRTLCKDKTFSQFSGQDVSRLFGNPAKMCHSVGQIDANATGLQITFEETKCCINYGRSIKVY